MTYTPTACDPPNSGVACTNPKHDHLGQIEAAQNGGDPVPDSDQLICGDCAAPMHYDYGDESYLHDDPATPACFLIRPPTPEPVDDSGRDGWIHDEILDGAS